MNPKLVIIEIQVKLPNEVGVQSRLIIMEP